MYMYIHICIYVYVKLCAYAHAYYLTEQFESKLQTWHIMAFFLSTVYLNRPSVARLLLPYLLLPSSHISTPIWVTHIDMLACSLPYLFHVLIITHTHIFIYAILPCFTEVKSYAHFSASCFPYISILWGTPLKKSVDTTVTNLFLITFRYISHTINMPV